MRYRSPQENEVLTGSRACPYAVRCIISKFSKFHLKKHAQNHAQKTSPTAPSNRPSRRHLASMLASAFSYAVRGTYMTRAFLIILQNFLTNKMENIQEEDRES